MSEHSGEDLDITVLMPCLNEAETVSVCVGKAMRWLAGSGLRGEVLVADNGSKDGSQALAEAAGARVVAVAMRGYGAALQAGIDAARGRWVIMGDADDSYDWLETPKFVAKLREGFELVQGCRLPVGGGRVMPGAMPTSHRWLGNPGLTWLARQWFNVRLNDVYCGMRGFTRELYDRLDLRSPGMEFATEMLIKASRYRAKVAETPITLHKDGRIAHPPHLRTIRDGWRTLRFFLLSSPRWLFYRPGAALIILGLIGYALSLFDVRIGGVHFALNTMIFASLAIITGFQGIMFAVAMKTLAVATGIQPHDRRLDHFYEVVTVERGAVAGLIGMFAGMAMLAVVVIDWGRVHFADLDNTQTLRWAIPGAVLTAVGFQMLFFSFFLGVLKGLKAHMAETE